ncbi:MAG: EAL domain-containing protein [Candidatus Dactylopiibacterium sp.]|nr:EAL domain-containing protein [Candidatus Dactylopiibacterium sp.]
MPRRRSIFLFSLLLAVSLPLVFAVIATEEIVKRVRQSRLDDFSDRALVRAEAIIKEAVDASMEADAPAEIPCSRSHILALREAALNCAYVREILYVKAGVPVCSSWSDHPESPVQDLEWNYMGMSPQGRKIQYRVEDPAGAEHAFVQFRVGRSVAVVDPRQYVDIVPLNPHMKIGVLDSRTGKVLAAWDGADIAFLEEVLLKHPANSSVFKGSYVHLSTSFILPVSVVAYQSTGNLMDGWQRVLLLVLPAALIISALLVWGMLRWGERFRGPRYTLSEALRLDQFFVCYQPMVELSSGRCRGGEALIRWRLPSGRIVMPDAFIPMAESLELIQSVTEWLINRVASDLGELLAKNPDLHVSINVSPRDLESGRFVTVLSAAMSRHGIRPEQVWIEVVERGFVDSIRCRGVIDLIRAAGHPLYIDDFGIGYSSLAYVHDLNIDGLKIDKSFVDGMTSESATRSVVPHIIRMGNALGVTLVAEGVEHEAQRASLVAQGVRYGQGWLFSKALSRDDFVAFCDRAD